MSCVIVAVAMRAQCRPMTWEEDTLMDRLRQLFGLRRSDNKQPDDAIQRRSNRMRYFLTVFGSQHWAERVDAHRT
jgi:hypothetical protein